MGWRIREKELFAIRIRIRVRVVNDPARTPKVFKVSVHAKSRKKDWCAFGDERCGPFGLGNRSSGFGAPVALALGESRPCCLTHDTTRLMIPVTSADVPHHISRHGTVEQSTPEATHDHGDFHPTVAALDAFGGSTHALKEAT